MERIRILIADDHPIVAEGIQNTLTNTDEFSIVDTVKNGQEAIDILRNTEVDILLLDIEMPIMNGVECMKQINQFKLDIKVIIFSMYQKPSIVKRLIELGVKGYILKTLEKDEFILALKKVHNGKEYFDSDIIKSLAGQEDASSKELVHFTEKSDIIEQLSKRELEVIILISKGFTNKQVGEKLFLSHKTVDGYRTKAMKKIGVNNTAGLIRFTFQNGLLHK